MFAKAKLNESEWKQLVASNPNIVKDQIQHGKYSNMVVNRQNGVRSSEIDRLTSARDRLDKSTTKLAKKYEYTPDGYTAYQSWHDHFPPNHFKR